MSDMELFTPLYPVVPVFVLITIGFCFAHWKKITLLPITELIVYLGTPSLVFTSLASKPILINDILVLAVGVLLIFTGVGFLIRLYFSLFRFSSRGFALPVLFMNAGNMGIPLALFAFGEPGMQRATLMFVIITFLQYSLGIYLLSGRGNWSEIFRLPLIYATITGLGLNLSRMTIPELLFQPISMLGQATIPIMLVSLGYRLHEFQSFKWRHAFGGALVRIFGGFTTAAIVVQLIAAEGVNRQVLLLYGALPAAVINFVLTEKYGKDPELAASIVVLSTFISVVTIPIVFWLIL
jgi:malate permease and related proteins